MRITLDSEICRRNGYSLVDTLYLLAISLSKKMTFPQHIKRLMDNDHLFVFNEKYELNAGVEAKLDKILIQSDKNVPQEDELIPLAEKMRDLFPKGIKDGTNQAWRDSTKLTARRLKAFMMQFGSYDPETILQATKEYVDSFNGNYAFMRTLKYFIMKNEVKPDADGKQHVEQTSDLATCIDNLGSNTSINFETGDLV